jgi:glycosyltransferase involved in cell wall biosynthesis
MPVICLDLGGPPTLLDEDCGVVVPARNASGKEVVSALGSALVRLETDHDLFASLSRHARLRAADLTWGKQIGRCLDLVATNVFKNRLSSIG